MIGRLECVSSDLFFVISIFILTSLFFSHKNLDKTAVASF